MLTIWSRRYVIIYMEELNDVIKSVDIVDYISQYVELEQRGNEWWGLSPFKEEHTPSFSVRQSNGTWFDFASGKGGNLYTFIKLYKNGTSKETVDEILKLAGCDGAELKRTPKLIATQCCGKYRHKPNQLKESHVNLLSDNYMECYEWREDKLKSWIKEGIPVETLKHFGVAYDSFGDNIVYPIRNPEGKIVNVGMRTLDPLYKEHGKSKYIYKQGWGGGVNTVYGISENAEGIRRKHQILLFEGAKSVMKAWSWGYDNCGALLTSHLSDTQLRILVKMGIDCCFFLDKEIKIKEDKNVQKLKRYCNVFYYWDYKDYLNDKDAPVDAGQDVFKELYEGRLRYK